MENDTIRKINVFGRVGQIISKIGQIILLIAAVSCLVGGLLMCLVPRDAVKLEIITSNSVSIHIDDSINIPKVFDLDTEDGILEIGHNTYKVTENGDAKVTRAVYLSDVKWLLLGGAVTCLAACVAFYFAGKLCEKIKRCITPFTHEISEGFTKLAWSLIPVCVVVPVMEQLTDNFVSGTFDFAVSFDLVNILLVLCVFMMSFVFKYGTKLQIESDETL